MLRCVTVMLLVCGLAPLFAQEKPQDIPQGKAKAKAKAQAKNKQTTAAPPAIEKEDESKVVFAFDPGAHTRPIAALGFNKDQSRLITVGWDYSIQIWSTSTGERLDIIRLPAYGRDNGFDTNRWNHAAISADGAYVAIGGGPKLLYGDNGVPTRLLVVDVANRRVRKLIFPAAPKSPVTCLSFSANGDRLAVGFGGADKSAYVLDGVQQLLKNAADAKLPTEPMIVVKGLSQEPYNLSLSPSGTKLVVDEWKGIVRIFDVAGKLADRWKKLGEFNDPGQSSALEWSPEETQFARSWRRGQGVQNTGMQLRAADGKMIQNWSFADLKPGFGKATTVGAIRYLDGNRLFVAAECAIEGDDRGCIGVVVDLKTGASTRRFEKESKFENTSLGAASVQGTLAANTTHQGMEAVIYNLASGKIVARCGSRSPFPTIVGWANDSSRSAIAWSDAGKIVPSTSKVSDLNRGFDLDKWEPLAQVDSAGFSQHRLTWGDWALSNDGRKINFNNGRLSLKGKEVLQLKRASAVTLIPTGNGPPMFASGIFDDDYGHGGYACLWDSTGKLLTELLPTATRVWDLAPSPDGRYLLVSTGTHRLSVHKTDGSRFPLLNFVQASGEWVCWTPEGYYASSPGGEKMIGWAESRGSNESSLFHSAETFSKQYRRPDVIKRAIVTGSVDQALKDLNAAAVDAETVLPPKAELKLIEQRGGIVKLQAKATSGSKEKPVVAVRVLLDGRPMPEGKGVWKPIPGKPAEFDFEITVPPGSHELKTLARSDDGSTVSEPLIVTGPKDANAQPTIHRVCVGVNDYDESGLKLQAATQDAIAVFASLGKDCVGAENRFGKATGELIVDKAATRDRVVKALADVRLKAKPGDLVVLFFAGHGLKQGNNFYLLTREADTTIDLAGRSLSGDDLRKALAEVECPVLLLLDACHSANAIKSFRPATDDLTRTLTDDAVGVTVLSAAMAHEVASATSDHGIFTAALLRALKGGEGVPFDPYERLLYVHHLYSVIFSDVRQATQGKQNPFLNMPWTVPPTPLREIPAK